MIKKGQDFISKYKKHPTSLILLLLTYLGAFLTFFFLVYLIFYILSNGLPYINKDLFNPLYSSDNLSLLPSLLNTLRIVFLALIMAVPLGIFSAIYLVEYAKKGNRLVAFVRITTETLSGIPSIIYGLFGMLFFVEYLRLGKSLLAGALTLMIMILPLIIRTSEEALMAVDDMYREGSFGLGAGKLRTLFKIVLPSAIPGILSGVILASGRIIGESAALIYTAGTFAQSASNIFSSGRTLSIHMYLLSSEGLYVNAAYATAVVLLIIVIVINALSSFIASRFKRG